MTFSTQQRLRFLSRPYSSRVGLIPVSAAITLGWLLGALGLWISTISLRYDMFWGSLCLLVVFVLITYLSFITFSWIHDSRMRFELELEGNRLHLIAYDLQRRNRVDRSVLLSEVERAEYYEARDVASLLLYWRGTILEVPLWSFGPSDERKIVDYVRACGVKVVGNPFDLPSLR